MKKKNYLIIKIIYVQLRSIELAFDQLVDIVETVDTKLHGYTIFEYRIHCNGG